MKFAVVDGFSTSRLLVRELRAHDVELVHIRSQRTAPESFERSFDPTPYELELPYSTDPHHIIERLKELGVERVVTGTESGVTLADALNHMLGFPGNDMQTARARRDKSAMVAALRSRGLAAPRGVTTTSADEAVAWFEYNCEWPVVVKPTMSAGTDNVRICRTAEQVRRACDTVLSSKDYFGLDNTAAIVQEYLVGSEYIVNTVSVNGVHKVSDVWTSNKLSGPVGAPLYDYQEPADLCRPEILELTSYVKRAITALGIREGAAHSEVMVTDRGPVLIETGARLMGTSLPDLSYEYSDVSHVHLFARSLCDVSGFDSYAESSVSWRRKLRYVWMINRTAGVAGSATWQDKYAGLPAYHSMLVSERSTDVVPRTVDVLSSPGLVALVADTTDELDRDYQAIRAFEEEGIYLS